SPRPSRGAASTTARCQARCGSWGTETREVGPRTLRALARAARMRGIRRVQGPVVGVTSTFTRERWAPGWTRIALLFIGLPTALTFDQNEGPGGFVFDPERRAAAALRADLRSEGIAVEG